MGQVKAVRYSGVLLFSTSLFCITIVIPMMDTGGYMAVLALSSIPIWILSVSGIEKKAIAFCVFWAAFAIAATVSIVGNLLVVVMCIAYPYVFRNSKRHPTMQVNVEL